MDVELANDGVRVAMVWRETTEIPAFAMGRTGGDNFVRWLGSDAMPIGAAIPVAGSAGIPGSPDVASSGSGFIVAWSERIAVGPSAGERHVLVQRYGADLATIGSPARVTGSWGRDPLAERVAVAWSPAGEYGMLVETTAGESRFARLGADGTSDSTPSMIASAVNSYASFDLSGAPDGSFAAIYVAAPGVTFRVIGPADVLAAPVVLGGDRHWEPRVVHDGAAWVTHNRTTGQSFMRRGALDRDATPVLSVDSRSTLTDVGLATFGGECVMVVNQVDGITRHGRIWLGMYSLDSLGMFSGFARYGRVGTLADDRMVVAAGGLDIMRLDASRLVITWTDERAGQRDIYALAVDVPPCL